MEVSTISNYLPAKRIKILNTLGSQGMKLFLLFVSREIKWEAPLNNNDKGFKNNKKTPKQQKKRQNKT